MNQSNKETKAKLLEMLFSGEITKEQFKKVLEIGLVCPVQFDQNNMEPEKTPHQKEIESLKWIYKRLGQEIFGITFKIDEKKEK